MDPKAINEQTQKYRNRLSEFGIDVAFTEDVAEQKSQDNEVAKAVLERIEIARAALAEVDNWMQVPGFDNNKWAKLNQDCDLDLNNATNFVEKEDFQKAITFVDSVLKTLLSVAPKVIQQEEDQSYKRDVAAEQAQQNKSAEELFAELKQYQEALESKGIVLYAGFNINTDSTPTITQIAEAMFRLSKEAWKQIEAKVGTGEEEWSHDITRTLRHAQQVLDLLKSAKEYSKISEQKAKELQAQYAIEQASYVVAKILANYTPSEDESAKKKEKQMPELNKIGTEYFYEMLAKLGIERSKGEAKLQENLEKSRKNIKNIDSQTIVLKLQELAVERVTIAQLFWTNQNKALKKTLEYAKQLVGIYVPSETVDRNIIDMEKNDIAGDDASVSKRFNKAIKLADEVIDDVLKKTGKKQAHPNEVTTGSLEEKVQEEQEEKAEEPEEPEEPIQQRPPLSERPQPPRIPSFLANKKRPDANAVVPPTRTSNIDPPGLYTYVAPPPGFEHLKAPPQRIVEKPNPPEMPSSFRFPLPPGSPPKRNPPPPVSGQGPPPGISKRSIAPPPGMVDDVPTQEAASAAELKRLDGSATTGITITKAEEPKPDANGPLARLQASFQKRIGGLRQRSAQQKPRNRAVKESTAPKQVTNEEVQIPFNPFLSDKDPVKQQKTKDIVAKSLLQQRQRTQPATKSKTIPAGAIAAHRMLPVNEASNASAGEDGQTTTQPAVIKSSVYGPLGRLKKSVKKSIGALRQNIEGRRKPRKTAVNESAVSGAPTLTAPSAKTKNETANERTPKSDGKLSRWKRSWEDMMRYSKQTMTSIRQQAKGVINSNRAASHDEMQQPAASRLGSMANNLRGLFKSQGTEAQDRMPLLGGSAPEQTLEDSPVARVDITRRPSVPESVDSVDSVPASHDAARAVSPSPHIKPADDMIVKIKGQYPNRDGASVYSNNDTNQSLYIPDRSDPDSVTIKLRTSEAYASADPHIISYRRSKKDKQSYVGEYNTQNTYDAVINILTNFGNKYRMSEPRVTNLDEAGQYLRAVLDHSQSKQADSEPNDWAAVFKAHDMQFDQAPSKQFVKLINECLADQQRFNKHVMSNEHAGNVPVFNRYREAFLTYLTTPVPKAKFGRRPPIARQGNAGMCAESEFAKLLRPGTGVGSKPPSRGGPHTHS